MNYTIIYENLIKNAVDRKLDCYVETHHIIPRCMNGDDNKLNLVELTAREHFIAHMLLCKIYPENSKLKFALWAMVNLPKKGNSRYKVSSRTYEQLKLQHSELLSKLFKGRNKGLSYEQIYGNEVALKLKEYKSLQMSGDKHPLYNVTGSSHPKFGHYQTDKWKEEQSIRMSGENNGMYGKTHSDEYKLRKSVEQKGEGNSFYGKTHSDETRKRLHEVAVNRKKYNCKFCNKEVTMMNLIRWHNDNCKHKKTSLG